MHDLEEMSNQKKGYFYFVVRHVVTFLRSSWYGRGACYSARYVYLDEFLRLGPLLECASELMRSKRQVGIRGDDVLLDRLNARPSSLLQSLDGFKRHLFYFGMKKKTKK